MLHEIFKGMDNSAEQINENFKDIEEATNFVQGQIQTESGFSFEGQLYKFGKMVVLNGTFRGVWGPTEEFDVGNVPNEFKPSDPTLTRATAVVSGNQTGGVINISRSDGKINIANRRSNEISYVATTMTWVTE